MKRELIRLWSLKKAQVVPIIVGAMGCASKGFDALIKLEIEVGIDLVQKTALLGTARILRIVLKKT